MNRNNRNNNNMTQQNNRRNNNNNKNRNNNRNNNYRQQQPQHKLNSSWSIYIHEVNEKDWSLESYIKVYTVKTIEDFWIFFNNFKDLNKYMFFIMRGDIKPVYEDPENKNGGSYSFMINPYHLRNTVIYTSICMLAEQLNKSDKTMEINGLSLVPKPNHTIMKIWTKTKQNPVKLTIAHQGLKNGRFQPHRFY